jgi:hypothetical protein
MKWKSDSKKVQNLFCGTTCLHVGALDQVHDFGVLAGDHVQVAQVLALENEADLALVLGHLSLGNKGQPSIVEKSIEMNGLYGTVMCVQ